jgi:DegV family protein with EDD domain
MAGIDTPSRDGGIALVTDSVCDLPIAFFTDRRIHVIPLQVSFDDEVLLDRIDITPNQFYTRLRTEAAHPTTSQPRPIDYMRVYKRLSERHEEILSIHVSAQLSGTLNAARSAAEKTTAQTGTRITVVDSRSASAAEGLVVWAAAQAIEQGLGSEASARVAAAAAENTSILVYVPTVKYFVRGGRLSPIQGRIARALHLLPILTVREGRVVPAGKAIGRRAAKKRVLRRTLQHAAGLRRPAFAVSHSAAPTLAREFEEALARRFPHAPMLCASVAPALGSHAGPGGATIAVFDAAILDDALGAAKNGSR